MRMSENIVVPTTVYIEDLYDSLCENLSYEELTSFIIDLDLTVGDTEFTEQLVIRLLKSLSECYPEEWSEVLEGILSQI